MTSIYQDIVGALADALHADTDICGGGCTQTAKRLAPALVPAVDAALTAALAERDAARAEVTRAEKRGFNRAIDWILGDHINAVRTRAAEALRRADRAEAEVAWLRAAVERVLHESDSTAPRTEDREAALVRKIRAALAATEDQP